MRKITHLIGAATVASVAIVGVGATASACRSGQLCDADIAKETSNITSTADDDEAAKADADLGYTTEPSATTYGLIEYELGAGAG